MPISEGLGGLLWRRVYEGEVSLTTVTTLNVDTLRTLLEQAGVPEPEDDVVFGKEGTHWHGRTMRLIR